MDLIIRTVLHPFNNSVLRLCNTIALNYKLEPMLSIQRTVKTSLSTSSLNQHQIVLFPKLRPRNYSSFPPHSFNNVNCLLRRSQRIRICQSLNEAQISVIGLRNLGTTRGNMGSAEPFDPFAMSAAPRKIAVIGSGNWGSAIARIVGENAKNNPGKFDPEVKMWVFEEMVEGQKLTEIINTKHENVKYLPGKSLPENVVAVPDIVETASDADVLIFVIPHQFVERSLAPLKGKLKEGVEGISLIKGFMILPEGGIQLISKKIHEILNIPISVLMGANLAGEVAEDKFCETTIGCADVQKSGIVYKKMFQTPNFRVVVVDDAATVEICGALKNIVACGAGFVDGLGLGDNTKAAVIRLGLMEMIKYAEVFHPGSKLSTFFESCGVADLITTCYGGRNRRVSEAFVKTGKSIDTLEKEMLNGQRLQGPETAAEVNHMLKAASKENDFPLFTAVHKICIGDMKAEKFVEQLRNHPEHMVKLDANL